MRLPALVCSLISLSACGSGLTCNDPRVLAELNNRFLQEDSIVTLSNDTTTGNLRCRAKIVGALAFDGLDYSVMETSSGTLVVQSEMTGRIM